jgi:hypothetical protein
MMSYNSGKRILFYAATWPDWFDKTNQDAFTQQLSNYVAVVAHRYPQLWCIQVNNESGYDSLPAPQCRTPEVTNTLESLDIALVKQYRACKAAVKGTKILIGGPAFSSCDWYGPAARIMDEFGGRQYIDVLIVHDYSRKHPLKTRGWTSPADVLYAKWKAIADRKPLVVGEFGIFGQSASSQTHPNTGLYVSGFTEKEAVRDAIQYAILMRAAGVDVIIPHILTNGGWHGDPANNHEISGWEFWDGVAPFNKIPMKSKTKAFLDAMRLLDGLTAAQIQALAKLARSLGRLASPP